MIITTGQIKTIWQDAYPECQSAGQEQHCPELIRCCGLFPDNPLENDNGICQVEMADNDFCTADGMYPDNVLCNANVIEAISYSEFAGIMSGMLVFGFVADRLGRARAGIIVSWLTFAGIFAMAFVDTQDTNTLFLIWAIFFGVFGLGVGGEYRKYGSTFLPVYPDACVRCLAFQTHHRIKFMLSFHQHWQPVMQLPTMPKLSKNPPWMTMNAAGGASTGTMLVLCVGEKPLLLYFPCRELVL